jgi:hypothetical protein
MSSQKGIIIFLILSSLIGLSFIFIRKASQAACPSEDQRVCAFVRKNNKISEKTMKGSYEQVSEEEENNLQVNWEKGESINRIKVKKNGNELLDVITSERYLFIKDYSDNLWWRQEKARMLNSIEELPFIPEMYFVKLNEIIKDERTTYKFIQEASCGSKTCYRYQVIYPELKEEDQLFIFFEKEGELLNSIFIADERGTGEIKISYADVTTVEPEKVKIAPDSRNLFLDYLDKKKQQEDKNYEYLKQFEQQRKEAEQSVSTNFKYVEETPIPTPTL